MLITYKKPKREIVEEAHVCDYCRRTIQPGEECSHSTVFASYIKDVDGEWVEDHKEEEWYACDWCAPYVREALTNEDYGIPKNSLDALDFRGYMMDVHCDIADEWWGDGRFLFGRTLPCPCPGHGWGSAIKPGDGEKIFRISE